MIDKKLLLNFLKKYPLSSFDGEKYFSLNKKKFYFNKIKCEVCNTSKYNIVFQNCGKINFDKEYYGYLPITICLKCGFKFLSPRQDDSFYKTFFHLDYGKTFHGHKNKFDKKKLQLQRKRGEDVFKFFNKILKSSNKKLLDHGCSTGITSLLWKKNGWEVSGIDPHRPSVEYGKKNFNLDLKCCYGESLDFKDNSFSLVISLGSLEHCYNLTKNLKEIRRVLIDNGNLLMRFRKEKITGSPLEFFNSITLRFFMKKNLIYLLNKNGFKNIKFIDKPIEGYETFSYLVAKKKNSISKNIKSPNEKSHILLKVLKNTFSAYCLRCLEVKKLKLDLKSAKFQKKILYIKKNKIALMNLGKKQSIQRFFDETKKFLIFLNQKKLKNDR